MSEYSTGLGLLYEILREKGYGYQLKKMEILDGGFKNIDKFKIFFNNVKIDTDTWNTKEIKTLNDIKVFIDAYDYKE